jgi:hypothetical protein
VEVQLVSPEQVLFTGEADMVIARTSTGGEIAFLNNHAPFLGALANWHVRLVLSDGRHERFAVHPRRRRRGGGPPTGRSPPRRRKRLALSPPADVSDTSAARYFGVCPDDRPGRRPHNLSSDRGWAAATGGGQCHGRLWRPFARIRTSPTRS